MLEPAPKGWRPLLRKSWIHPWLWCSKIITSLTFYFNKILTKEICGNLLRPIYKLSSVTNVKDPLKMPYQNDYFVSFHGFSLFTKIRGREPSNTYTWMQIINPSKSAKPVMTKLPNFFGALVNMDIVQITLKISLFTVD